MWSAMGAAFRAYARFGGRSERSLFERFFMSQVVIGGCFTAVLLFAMLWVALTTSPEGEPWLVSAVTMAVLVLMVAVYGLVLFLPVSAMVVRRLHDANWSGWWFWGWFVAYSLFMTAYLTIVLSLAAAGNEDGIVVAGGVSYFFSIPLSILMYVILYRLAQPGTAGDNRFGAALIEFEPDGPVDGVQAQVSGFFRGVGCVLMQNWHQFNIQGRLSRSEYWCFHVVLIPLALLSYVLLVMSLILIEAVGIVVGGILFALALALMIAVLWLSVATGIRRLHDIGYSGWWALISLVPPLGMIAWLYLIFKPSIAGGNRFGPQPMPML